MDIFVNVNLFIFEYTNIIKCLIIKNKNIYYSH